MTVSAKGLPELIVGEKHISQGRTVTEADLVMFTRLAWSRAPIHTDRLWSKQHTQHPDLLLHGHLIMAMAVGLDTGTGAYTGRVGRLLGFDKVRVLDPVYPGDTIHVVSEIVKKRDYRDGKQEVVSIKYTVYNQKERKVLEFLRNMLWNKQPLG
ncbi:MAG: MaoC family dehydratase N-terminal domain-containing protein [Chloroflexi bacterium]|nr:MaoC family dehydratase N-terminal domain-containing protein [Chloroflexota bacterium]